MEQATDKSLHIEEWDSSHVEWKKLSQLIAMLEQTRWAETQAEWHLSSHFLVAHQDRQIAGFLRFVIQIIGTDEDHEPVVLNHTPLTEAKIIAFGVDPAWRRRGIGRALQTAAIQLARRYGCYQIRSHSSGTNADNHRLKLSMGFAVHPVVRGNDTRGVYFIMPLSGNAT